MKKYILDPKVSGSLGAIAIVVTALYDIVEVGFKLDAIIDNVNWIFIGAIAFATSLISFLLHLNRRVNSMEDIQTLNAIVLQVLDNYKNQETPCDLNEVKVEIEFKMVYAFPDKSLNAIKRILEKGLKKNVQYKEFIKQNKKKKERKKVTK